MSEDEQKKFDKECYRNLLASPHGRRILWKMISSCGVYTRSADNSGSWTYFKEGQRSIGLNIIAELIDADPQGYIKLQQDNL